jgi:predicted RNase H-like HicB family nuclease
MKINSVVHQTEEAGLGVEAPTIPGCAPQSEIMDKLMRNVQEVIEGCLSVNVAREHACPNR